MLYPVSAQTKPTMPRLGDADRVCFANRSIPRRRRLRDAELFLKKSATHKKIIAFQMAQRKMV